MGLELIFLKVLNMSLSASLVAFIILLIHFLLRKLPKKYSYFLWIIVFLRFLIPITIESSYSLIPLKTETFSINNIKSEDFNTNGSITNSILEKTTDYSNTSLIPFNERLESNKNLNSIILWIGTILWLFVVTVIALISTINLIKLKVRLRTATQISNLPEYIYESSQIVSPFLIGILKPRIYLPLGLTEEEIYHVISHEKIHLIRRDYLFKPFAFIAVILHWFNPIAWLSFYLFTKDMEMSCDEIVMEHSNDDIRSEYSKSLLSLSMKQSGLLTPLAFGESNTKSRIKNILNFKKPSTWISFAAILVLIIAAITLLPNSKPSKESILNKDEKVELSNSDLAKELYRNRTPYIGDNSKVAALVYALSVPKGLIYKSIELQTDHTPYQLHVFYEYDTKSNIDPKKVTLDEFSEIEFQNFAYLFATIENMDECTFHIIKPTGEITISYKKENIEEIIDTNLYSYSENPASLEKLMMKVNEYLSHKDEWVETQSYTGRPLKIGIIGEIPGIREEQVSFHNIEFSDLLKKIFQEEYDAIFISKENLSEAAKKEYKSIYKESTIPFFFIQSDKAHIPFVDEELSYEDVPDLSKQYYVTGLFYKTYKTWGYGLYNDKENETNIKDVYTRIFKTIEEVSK